MTLRFCARTQACDLPLFMRALEQAQWLLLSVQKVRPVNGGLIASNVLDLVSRLVPIYERTQMEVHLRLWQVQTEYIVAVLADGVTRAEKAKSSIVAGLSVLMKDAPQDARAALEGELAALEADFDLLVQRQAGTAT